MSPPPPPPSPPEGCTPLFLYPGYAYYTLPEPGTALLYTNPNPPTVLYAITAPPTSDYNTTGGYGASFTAPPPPPPPPLPAATDAGYDATATRTFPASPGDASSSNFPQQLLPSASPASSSAAYAVTSPADVSPALTAMYQSNGTLTPAPLPR